MSKLEFRKFETFDLKTGEEYVPSTKENNYNQTEGEKEDFIVGYRTEVPNTLFGTKEFKIRLAEARGIYYNTTDYWHKHNCIPKEGDIYIYADARVIGADGEEVITPQMKVGTGNAYLSDLRFMNQDIANRLEQHIVDNERHLMPGERKFWNNKLNVDPDKPVSEDGTLLLNRD